MTPDILTVTCELFYKQVWIAPMMRPHRMIEHDRGEKVAKKAGRAKPKKIAQSYIQKTPEEESLDNLEKLDVTYQELLYIKTQMNRPSSQNLRKISIGLRLLLVDNNLVHSWKYLKLLPQNLIVRASFVPPKSLETLAVAMIARISLETMELGQIFQLSQHSSRPPAVKVGEDLKLDEFMKSIVLAIDGTEFSRQDIVLYVAHKKGGAHINTKRLEDEKTFVKLDRIVGFRVGGTVDVEKGDRRPIGSLSIVYAALLSIAQELLNSPCIEDFLALTQRKLDDEKPFF